MEIRSDGAARPVQIVIGNNNTEVIKNIRITNSWDTGHGWYSSTPLNLRVNNLTSYTSPRFDDHMQWVASKTPQTIDVWLTRTNGDVCISSFYY
jgi:hypothetical protein